MRMWRKQMGAQDPEPKKEEKNEDERKVGEKTKEPPKAGGKSSSSKNVDMEHKKKIFKRM